MDKLLTVVIPTYNMEKYLRKCLDSLIIPEEQMEKLEVLVINDGSKDSSSAIAHEYEARYPGTFRVIDKENGNYGSCMNRGLKEAKGMYIKICDADDWYENQSLPAFLAELERGDSDIIISPYYRIHEDINRNELVDIPEIYKGKTFTIVDNTFSTSCLDELLAMHALTTNTSLLRDYSYHQTEGISYTDTQIVFYSWLWAKTVSFANTRVYCYRLGRNGQTMSLSSLKRSCPHLLQNAERLLGDLQQVANSVDENTRYVLEKSVRQELYFFNLVFFHELSNGKEFDERYRGIATSLDDLAKAGYPMLLDYFLRDKSFLLWYKKGWSQHKIYLLNRIKDPLVQFYTSLR